MKYFQQIATIFPKYFTLTTLVVLNILFIHKNQSWAVDSSFACGGNVENEAWHIWDMNVKKYLLEHQLQDRLLKHGDVYVLYDFQSYTHNLVAMARRCNRTNRLQEVAGLIEVAYSKLEAATPDSSGRRWVCRGGNVCNDKNKLLNKEVMLDSVQFLGIAASVANAMATSKASLSDNDKLFIRNTTQIVIEHLLRWSDKAAIESMHKTRSATPKDVKNGSSALFFTDKPLWLITIYSELAGILNSEPAFGIRQISPSDMVKLSHHFNELLLFFHDRLLIKQMQNSRLGVAAFADLDRGYWRLYADNQYAGYEKVDKPVMCVYSGKNKNNFKIVVTVPPDNVPKRQDIGWDLSHARRLVHALDALERNRQSIGKIFNLRDEQLPPEKIADTFANTLIGLVWNGDKAAPLFSNYWSGANGWYRVAYDNGTGQCREGTPPFGLSDSFPTGGFVTWAKYNPMVGVLGKRLYNLFISTKHEDTAFVAKYYAQFGTSARVEIKSLANMMFLPSLVGVSIK